MQSYIMRTMFTVYFNDATELGGEVIPHLSSLLEDEMSNYVFKVVS